MTNVKPKIVVTGFGPFGKHTVNASWSAVKRLKHICCVTDPLHDVDLVIEEIPVCYDKVDERVLLLWKEHNPVFVIHVGVSDKAHCLTIENEAHSTGYTRADICNKYPNEIHTDDNVIQTEINIRNICDSINRNLCCEACISHDAGRYLCEYTFYQSLRIDPTKTLFIHIPDSNVYPPDVSARGLYHILCDLLQPLRKLDVEKM